MGGIRKAQGIYNPRWHSKLLEYRTLLTSCGQSVAATKEAETIKKLNRTNPQHGPITLHEV
jgi:hypothetical protein